MRSLPRHILRWCVCFSKFESDRIQEGSISISWSWSLFWNLNSSLHLRFVGKKMGREMVDSEQGSSSASSSSSFSHFAIFHNYPLISAILAFAIAQTGKFIITWYKENRWDPKRLVGSGGMPSSHSSTVTALAMAVGFSEGFGSSYFATAVILAAVVMYDAFGVRLHAGRQAEVLNQIVLELPSEHPLADTRPLHELLGHTPPEVLAGAILGVVVATVAYIMTTFGAKA